jgi:hypothetical protein
LLYLISFNLFVNFFYIFKIKKSYWTKVGFLMWGFLFF